MFDLKMLESLCIAIMHIVNAFYFYCQHDATINVTQEYKCFYQLMKQLSSQANEVRYVTKI